MNHFLLNKKQLSIKKWKGTTVQDTNSLGGRKKENVKTSKEEAQQGAKQAD